ncbi:Na(+)/H(+) antiporter subunit D [Paenibacillus sp. GM2FR]|uniref:Na+/H+ antiporter subunit D n=1 Tax=Paenibacillus TaxID=44249 RepID=UPI000C27F736|nr:MULTISPECIES: Na+/H+ antiporter subunit D [Paenibacillus]MEC0310542.1 Na+/H+ antiporter subunit D [Paenibacillus lautus]PJN55750.1 Na(+)/H(+) antiporter subunit D [Paenibacillus sp. GM2FR]
MNNVIVLPLLIPLVTAVILIFCSKYVRAQRWISVVSVILNLLVALFIVNQVNHEGIQTLYMGGWLPPYGIVFVADMLAALLVLTTLIVAAACLFYSFRSIGEEREKHYFYAFFQFLLAGVIGSFLTGDLFNLFVCFEVMLIASYALIVLGGTKRQLRETLKYMLINIISSTLFVAAVAYLYGTVGTLNMAHLSLRVAEVQQDGILSVIGLLFLIVFALKAGLFLFFWLPGSYSAPPAAVTALFGALLTKVGLYAIIRTFTLIFHHDTGGIHVVIGWMAAATMILGSLGAVAYKDLGRILNYNIIISVGFIAFGVAVASSDSLNGAVFYLMHDMIAKALLFILGGIIMARAGTNKLSEMGGLMKRHPLVGWMFFIVALALVGIPPLSGFLGKVLIVRGGLSEGHYVLTGLALASSLAVLYSLIKVFMGAFWGESPGQQESKPVRIHRTAYAAAIGLTVMVIVLGVGSEWIYSYTSQAGAVLSDPSLYINAVLKE